MGSTTPLSSICGRRGATEPLIHAESRYGTGIEGNVYTIDLLERKKTEGASEQGDIRVRLLRPAEVDPKHTFDWSFMMEAVQGGIIETTDTFLYRAPQNGYQPRYELVMSHSDPNWSDTVRKKFYVRSREGKVYASLQMTIYPDYDGKSGIAVNYLANPAGSPNLEFDPAKQINK
jgi:hypothetical protein